MQQLVVGPVQWSQLPDMESMNRELDDSDAECLAEVRDVLLKHGKVERLGVSLLHRHFDLGADEALLETLDAASRTLVVRPVPKTELGSAVQTQWSLSSNDPLQWCEAYCNYNNGHHHGHQRHITRGS